MKRPAAAAEEVPAKVLKRPASAIQQDHPASNDDDEEEDELRDRLKARKFSQLWAAVPEAIKAEYNGDMQMNHRKTEGSAHVAVITQQLHV